MTCGKALLTIGSFQHNSSWTRTSIGYCDKEWVHGFAEQAQNLMDAALAALDGGEPCREMTVLIGRDGGIQMWADSDWPLDSLMLDRGARTGYRISTRADFVRVEGREGMKRCLLESRRAPRSHAGMRSGIPGHARLLLAS